MDIAKFAHIVAIFIVIHAYHRSGDVLIAPAAPVVVLPPARHQPRQPPLSPPLHGGFHPAYVSLVQMAALLAHDELCRERPRVSAEGLVDVALHAHPDLVVRCLG
jgi:hypothetical protein